MEYDNLCVMSYNLGLVDYGAGDVTRYIRIPRGATFGRILEVNHDVTETFTNTTTAGATKIGRSGSLAAYLSIPLGVTATGASYGLRDVAATVLATPWRKSSNDISELIVTCLAPTGGTPAGIALVTVVIGWDNVAPLQANA